MSHITASISTDLWRVGWWSIFHIYTHNNTIEGAQGYPYQGYRCANATLQGNLHLDPGRRERDGTIHAQQQRRAFPETAPYEPPVPRPPPPPLPPPQDGNGGGDPPRVPGRPAWLNAQGLVNIPSWEEIQRFTARNKQRIPNVLPRSKQSRITLSTYIAILVTILCVNTYAPPHATSLMKYNRVGRPLVVPFSPWSICNKQRAGVVSTGGPTPTSMLCMLITAIVILSSVFSWHHPEGVEVEEELDLWNTYPENADVVELV